MTAPRTFPEAIGVIPALRTIRGLTVTSDGRVYGRSGRRLSPNLAQNGYLRVASYSGGCQTTEWVHQLVCEAFNGPRPEWAELVRHRDGDPMNNHADNVTYGTHAENAADRIAHGRSGRGESRPRAKLTPNQVREIRESPPGVTQRELAKRYGVSDRHIRHIKDGTRRGNVS